MPYPLQFRPNTTCHIWNPDGSALDGSRPLQIFRPMLGTRFNPLVPDFDQHMEPGGILLRFTVESDALSAFYVGPSNWRFKGLPFITLDEDPLNDAWYVSDLVCWDGPGGSQKLLSGFASKKLLNLASSISAPATVPTFDLSAAEILFGPLYSATVPATSFIVFRLPLGVGDVCAVNVMQESVASQIRIHIRGGSPTGAVNINTAPPGSNFVSMNPVTLSPGTTPIVWVGFENINLALDDDILFTVRRGLTTGRDIR